MDSSLVEMDKLMEMKDRNGLSYKVDRLPKTASGQLAQDLLGVLPDHVQQGQRFGKFTRQATVVLPDGCTFFKGFTQVSVQVRNQVGDDFIGGCHARLQKIADVKKPPRGWLVVVRD